MTDTKTRMPYRQYKQHYADCETVPGTYDAGSKSIVVIVPAGRMKASGVRGRHFSTYELWWQDERGEKHYTPYRAISRENAMKQLCQDLKQHPGCVPCDPPENRIARAYTHRSPLTY